VLVANDREQIKPLLSNGKRMVAVTLTGQVSRVELQSKIDYLLGVELDNRLDNVNLVVFVVMTDDKPRFSVYQNAVANSNAEFTDKTLAQMIDKLRQHIDWPIVALKSDADLIALQTPTMVTKFYRSQSYASDIFHGFHIIAQQFTSLCFASSLIDSVERQFDFQFDFVVKLRDDDFLLSTFNLNTILAHFDTLDTDLLAVGCIGVVGGVNDHLRVFKRIALKATSFDSLTISKLCLYVVCKFYFLKKQNSRY
jgi:hypothetical protein